MNAARLLLIDKSSKDTSRSRNLVMKETEHKKLVKLEMSSRVLTLPCPADYEEAVVTAVENRLELAAPNSKDAESKEGQQGPAALENGERVVASGLDQVAPASERQALAEGKLERGRRGLDKVPVVGKLVGRLVAMLRKAQ